MTNRIDHRLAEAFKEFANRHPLKNGRWVVRTQRVKSGRRFLYFLAIRHDDDTLVYANERGYYRSEMIASLEVAAGIQRIRDEHDR